MVSRPFASLAAGSGLCYGTSRLKGAREFEDGKSGPGSLSLTSSHSLGVFSCPWVLEERTTLLGCLVVCLRLNPFGRQNNDGIGPKLALDTTFA